MLVNKAFRFRIYPNKEQEVLIAKTIGCTRFVFNYFLGQWQETYKETDKELSYSTCYAGLPGLKGGFPWLKEYSLLHDEQELLKLRVFQTLDPYTRSLEDAIFTGIAAVIEDIPQAENGIPHPIKVDFSIDSNHLIQLRATITTTGQSLEFSLSPNELRIDDVAEFLKRKKQLDVIQ